MPKLKNHRNGGNDEFFTKQHVVDLCLATLPDFDGVVIEPSAGSGKFLHSFKYKNKRGIDITPRSPDILKGDWLEYKVEETNFWVVGNPPFGFQSKLAIKFFNHAADNGASIIAFILPSIFKKKTIQNKLNNNYILEFEMDLPPDSFDIDGNTHHVPCVWQIWKRSNTPRPIFKQPTGNKFLKFDNDGQWFMFGAAPHRIIKREQVVTNNRGYYLTCSEDVIKWLRNINWKQHAISSVSGGVCWFNKHLLMEIIDYEVSSKQQPK